MQMPDELYQKVLELHIYFQQAIMKNDQEIANLEAENDFFQAQLYHTDALIAGSGHQPKSTDEQSQINQSEVNQNADEAKNQDVYVNHRPSNLYRGMPLIGAISKVLEQHPGKALNAADTGKRILPRHYSRERRAFLYGAIAKELSRGAKEGRFDRAQERGYYISKARGAVKA